MTQHNKTQINILVMKTQIIKYWLQNHFFLQTTTWRLPSMHCSETAFRLFPPQEQKQETQNNLHFKNFFLTCCHLKMEYKVDPEMTWFSLNLSLCFFTSGHLRQDGQTKGSPQRQRDRQVTERQVWKMKMRCLSDQWQSVAYRRVGDGYRSALIFVKAWLWTDVVRSSINHNQHGFGWKIWPWTFNNVWTPLWKTENSITTCLGICSLLNGNWQLSVPSPPIIWLWFLTLSTSDLLQQKHTLCP